MPDSRSYKWTPEGRAKHQTARAKQVMPSPSEKTREKIAASRRASKNPNWKGGPRSMGDGYMKVLRLEGGYIREHRLVMEKFVGRSLRSHETVHHINGKRDDNRIENLELWSTRHPRGVRVETMSQEMYERFNPVRLEEIRQIHA